MVFFPFCVKFLWILHLNFITCQFTLCLLFLRDILQTLLDFLDSIPHTCKQQKLHFFLFYVIALDFFFFAIASIFTKILNRSGEKGHIVLIPDLRGNAFRFTPIQYNDCNVSVVNNFETTQESSFNAHLFESFYYAGKLDLAK